MPRDDIRHLSFQRCAVMAKVPKIEPEKIGKRCIWVQRELSRFAPTRQSKARACRHGVKVAGLAGHISLPQRNGKSHATDRS